MARFGFVGDFVFAGIQTRSRGGPGSTAAAMTTPSVHANSTPFTSVDGDTLRPLNGMVPAAGSASRVSTQSVEVPTTLGVSHASGALVTAWKCSVCFCRFRFRFRFHYMLRDGVHLLCVRMCAGRVAQTSLQSACCPKRKPGCFTLVGSSSTRHSALPPYRCSGRQPCFVLFLFRYIHKSGRAFVRVTATGVFWIPNGLPSQDEDESSLITTFELLSNFCVAFSAALEAMHRLMRCLLRAVKVRSR